MHIVITRRGMTIVLGVLIVLGAIWYWASPRWTLYEMRSAAEAKDSGKLAGYIDFPAVRESFRAAIKANTASELSKDKDGGNSLGAAGAAIGAALADGLIDTMVTPETMAAAFNSRSDDGGKALGGFKVGKDGSIVRDGLDQFRLHDDTKGGDLVFTRHGLGWELSGVNLATDAGSEPVVPPTNCPAVGAC